MEKTQPTEMPIKSIKTNGNHRSSMNPASLKELTDNIKKFGILVPMIVKPDGTLIAGHRRLAAAKDADLKTVPVRVMDVDEKTAAEIQAFENLHRDNLSPLDEARAFKELLTLGQHTAESLAQHVDKSSAYVYRSIRLLELPEKALHALEEGKITTGHAQQILRAAPENWEKITKYALTQYGWMKRLPTVDELRQEVERGSARNLDEAVFPKDKEFEGYVAPGKTLTQPCTTCTFNSGNQETLFDGAEKGKCLFPGCFSKKTKVFYKLMRVQAEKQYPTIKYVGEGVTNRDYNSNVKTLKGAVVIDKITPEIKKAMAATPEKFQVAVRKPQRGYMGDGVKTAKVVLLCKDAKLAGVKLPKETNAQPRDWEKERFAGELTDRLMAVAVFERLDPARDARKIIETIWEQDISGEGYGDIFRAAGIDVNKFKSKDFPKAAIDALTASQRIKLAFLCLLIGSEAVQMEDVAEELKIDTDQITKSAKTQIDVLWKKKQDEKTLTVNEPVEA
jgi:ParB/RepB/Spo0J family partition protein